MRAPEPIGICGAATLNAVGDGPDQTAAALVAGRSGVRQHTEWAEVSGTPYPVGAVVVEVDHERPTARAGALAVTVARQAWTEAGAGASAGAALFLATTKADVDLGVGSDGVGGVDRTTADPAGLLAYVRARLAWRGPAVVVSTACASGLDAVIHAARWLRRGAGEVALVIGVDVLGRFTLAGFGCLGALSRGVCRPFDEARDGLNLGEGAGALVLRRGVASGCRAVLRGWGQACDAHHLTAPSEEGRGLAQAIRAAFHVAQLPPAAVGYVNAHGTATRHNDAAEARALQATIAAGTPVSSMKPMLGHTLGAAGVVELAACLGLLRLGMTPPNLHLLRSAAPWLHLPNRSLQLNQPAVLSVKLGFGGLNAAVILEATGG